ncbi:MAG: helix-turn-helix domain-containing protein [Thalassotalea sp.]
MKSVIFNTHDVVLLITIFQCILFALFLLTLKKGRRQSNVLLAIFLLANAAIPLDNLINFGEMFRQIIIEFSPHLFYVFGLAYWLEPVVLLFYVRTLIYKDYQFKKQHLVYLLPLLVYFIHESNQWYFLDGETKIAYLTGYSLADAPDYIFGINFFRECFRALCGILCLIELRRYHQHIKNEFSDIEAIDLTWLKVLIFGFLVIYVFAIFVTIGFTINFTLGINIDYELIGLTSNYAVLLLISFLVYFSLGFTSMFKGIDTKIGKPASDKNPIDLAQIEKITHYMSTEKPYLYHLLTLDNLATQLNMSARQLSQNINRHFKQNFFEFINSYRIEESKQLLTSEKHAKSTMLDIMDLAGFNSKATFNTMFKKLVNVTPTQYRKEQFSRNNNT